MDYTNYIEHYGKDAEAYNYRPPVDSPEGQVERRRAEFILHILGNKLLRPDAKILDIGTGGGEMLRQLARAGAFPVGLDVALLNLQNAAKRLKENGITHFALTLGDAYVLPFKDTSIDALILSEVVEHLGKPEKAIAEAARVLKPRGQLVISVPYKEKIVYHLCIHCNRPTPANAHLHSFDETSVRKLLKGLPLAIEREAFFHNKALNLLRIHYYVRRFPYLAWRTLDLLANLIIPKPHYYVIVARKESP